MPAPDLRSERGFTVIEVIVALAIVLGGVLASVEVLDHSRRLSGQTERRETVAHEAQQELERALSLPYAELAHDVAAGPPSTSPDTIVAPVTCASAAARLRYDRRNSSAVEFLRTADTGRVPSVARAWTDGQSRLRGSVQTFVTELANANCAPDTANRLRRVTVVATVGPGGGAAAPVITSTVVSDPGATS